MATRPDPKSLTVDELIERLRALPPEVRALPVVYRDAEWGHLNVNTIEHLTTEQAKAEEPHSPRECVRLQQAEGWS